VTDDVEEKLVELAARFDAELARLDAMARVTPEGAANRRTPLSRTAIDLRQILNRLQPPQKPSPWDGVTQRLSELERYAKSLRRKAKDARTEADEWERRAMLCVKARNDDLAQAALHNRREALEQATDLEVRAKQIEDARFELQRCIEEIKGALQSR